MLGVPTGQREWWTLDVQKTYWTPTTNTGCPKQILDTQSEYWDAQRGGHLTPRVNTGYLESVLDAQSKYWTPEVCAGRPEQILDTWSGGHWMPGANTECPKRMLDI